MVIGLVLACGVIASYTNLPLPAEVALITATTGRVQKCDIENYTGGKSSPSLLFVGIAMEGNVVPYLRWNPSKAKLADIRAMCKEQRLVNVTYRAKRTLLRPRISYWIERLDIKP